MALGSRLRRLSERFTEDAVHVYKLYNTNLHPKWFPVFYVLSAGKGKTITSIAEEIGHSHPSVIKIIREMSKHGLVVEKNDKHDGRRNIVSLSRKGREVAGKIQPQYTDVRSAIDHAFTQTANDLWRAIDEWELLLSQKSIFRRVQEQKKLRESKNIRIVKYQPKYQKAFKQLNEEWILEYFTMEDADRQVMDHPKKNILDAGGHIFVALHKDKPVGVCALLKMNDPEYDFELAKMAVAPAARGMGIGELLGHAAIEKAKTLHAKKIYLGSNTMLKPAINLYYKLGFSKIAGHETPYERCNFQMELALTD
jgi:DNA-binding MarR family transcriptional regulator